MAETLAQELLREAGGDPLQAAVNMAVALMQDDPHDMKAGYTQANAEIAAAEYMGVDRQSVHDALERRKDWKEFDDGGPGTTDTDWVKERDDDERRHTI